jgi:oligopeptide/dipeptide ABC transporter ATP-binding protein
MQGPLLEARGLVKHFPVARAGGRGVVRAVDGVDLVIAEGETHGLVGESGSGKSTVGRLLLRLVPPDAGVARFRGEDLFALPPARLRELRRHLGLVYQDPASALDPRFSARDIVAEPWAIHGMHDLRERQRRADELLARVGIDPSVGHRRPGAFSGGQQQRIGIARALALEPSLIVCDEPVSALDVSVRGQIVNLLLDLKAERRLAYLFIAHDLAVVRHVSDRISVMFRGRIVETGTREEVFGRPAHPYTRALLAAMDPGAGAALARSLPAVDATRLPDAGTGCAYRARCPIAQARCASEAPALVERGQGHPVACHFPEGEAEQAPASRP